MIFSSKTTGLFHDSDFGGELPADAVEISPELHEVLLNGQSSSMKISFDTEPPTLIDRPIPVRSCPELCSQIDEAADRAREAVAGDPLRAVEYQRSADQAKAFKAAGYPADDVPPMVAAWAISGRTPRQAAESILAEAAVYNGALEWIRTTRLAAKEQVKALTANEQPEEAEAVANTAVDQIRAAVAGIGSNTGTGV